MRISIALASYEGAKYIVEQLESFVRQTRLPDEVCVSDDCSGDDTLARVRRFATTAPFIVKCEVNPVRGGVNQNFENAVGMCSGDVILFSDQDDVWLPQHIAQLVIPLQANPRIMAVASDSLFVDASLNPTGITQMQSDRFPPSLRAATNALPPNQLKLVLRQNIHSGHGMAFRRTLLPLLLPFTSTFMFDEWVLILAASAGFITYADIPLTLHRQHGAQSHGARNKDLKVWAAQSKNLSAQQERVQEDKWGEMLQRVREHRAMLADPQTSESALQEKLDFVIRRTTNRRRALPSRLVLTVKELLSGRYHRLGRGWLTFARDLYGVRR